MTYIPNRFSVLTMRLGQLDFLDKRDDWDIARRTVNDPSIYSRYDVTSASCFHWNGEKAEAAYFRLGDLALFHPHVRRRIEPEPGLYELASPYEFGGFWTNATTKDESNRLMAAFWSAFGEDARKRGYVASFQRLCPWMNPHLLPNGLLPLSERADHVVVDLTRPYGEIRKSFRANTRNKIKRAEKAGLVRTEEIDLSTGLRILHGHLKTLNAQPGFFFPEAYFHSFGDELETIAVGMPGEPMMAVGFFVHDGPVLTWLQSGRVPNSESFHPTNLVLDIAIRRGIELGCDRLHLGGGQPTILHFKTGYSDDRMKHYHLRAIFDEKAYQALCGGNPPDNGFFPFYRRPDIENGRRKPDEPILRASRPRGYG